MIQARRLPTDLIEKYRQLSTPNISDALDRLGIAGGCLGLVPIVPGVRLVGAAFTVRYVPAGVAKGTVGDYIEDVEPGQVVALDNAARTHCTVWGDLLTTVAHQGGVAGTIIDGVCRDVPQVRELHYPVFARGAFMVTGKDRVEVAGINVPVTIGGIQVKPGDLVAGDDSGVVIVPWEKVDEVLAAASEIRAAEESIEQAVRRGEKLSVARAKVGYHRLQSRR